MTSLSVMAEPVATRIILPPISTFMPDAEFEELICMPRPAAPVEQLDPLESSGPYRVDDDLSIFRAIRSFYGESFNGTVPWSFWQTYRRLTGSNRSTSSLYHHWNGSIRRKYGSYLREKNIEDCIKHIESEKNTNSAKMEKPPMRIAMPHNWAGPVPLGKSHLLPVTP